MPRMRIYPTRANWSYASFAFVLFHLISVIVNVSASTGGGGTRHI
jgi:hypothetical protein